MVVDPVQGFADSALVVGSFHVAYRLTEEGQQRTVRLSSNTL